jgi:uncharacterized protein (UPF0332 family)
MYFRSCHLFPIQNIPSPILNAWECNLNARDLIRTAKKLVPSNGKPKQSDLRRACSTVYYALFHTLAKCCADSLTGVTPKNRSNGAWRQAYRALEHGASKNACRNLKTIAKFPVDIQDFANHFVSMQEKRHDADYNPVVRLTKSGVLNDIGISEKLIQKFNASQNKHKRAFVTLVLLKNRD